MKTLQAVRFGTIALLFCVQTSALAATFTHDAFISFSDHSYDGEDIVVTNCTLTVDGTHAFNSLSLINDGVVTHSAFSYGPQVFLLSVFDEPHVLTPTNAAPLDNTNIDAGSIVVMDATGTTTYTENVDYLLTSSGGSTFVTLTTNSAIFPGSTVLINYDWIESFQGFNLSIANGVQIDGTSSIDVSGKGYSGGLGFQTGAGAFQFTNFPFNFTAGGGGAHGGAGGMSDTSARGGAAYGSITNPASLGSGGGQGTQLGGSGGGMASLTIGGNLQLDGLIVANGLKGTNAHSGGGAGGSIFISAQSISGAGTIAANGGGGDLPDGGGGGGGRVAIYFRTNNFTGRTIAFGGNGANAGGAGTVYMRPTGSAAGQLSIINGGQRGTDTPFSAVKVADLRIGGGAVAQSQSTSINVTNLFIGSNSWLTISNTFPINITVANNATIESNGMINADSKSASGPGTGAFNGCGAGSGGSYGGYGGNSVCGASSGMTYGSLTQPTSFGSAGGLSGGASMPAARGGGFIEMNVGGTLSLNGRISANGEAATFAQTGAGSGGSIWLTVGTLSGGGTISANGGSASNLVSGAGGGGRVAVYYNSNLFTGNFEASGGSGTNNGGPGTVYLKSNPFASFLFIPKVIVDNGGRVGTTILSFAPGVFDLQISGGAIATNFSSISVTLGNLFIGSNSWFSAAPNENINLTIQTNATIQNGGGITADGISTSTIGAGMAAGLFGGGGGNGGNGGNGVNGPTNALGGSQSSGSITQPSNPGGIGGSGSLVASGSLNAGGKGGGIISLNALGTLQLDGAISANGISGPGFNSGGGAGGSIQVTTKVFSGAGLISANGGAANNGGIGGGGGGGRIAVSYQTNLYSGSFSAHGGAGANYGGAGTIFVAGAQFGISRPVQLTIDNGGTPGAVTPLPSTIVLPETVNLTITGGASVSNANAGLRLVSLLVGSNSALQIFGTSQLPISASSNITVQAGGSINADGTSVNASNNSGQTLNSTGGGGGGAGMGGNSALGALGGVVISDSLTFPVQFGGRGGSGIFNAQQIGNGGNGGRSLQITANGTLRLDGRISADGAASPSVNGGGGGGGSVVLSCRTFVGSGTISANGGAGNGAGGGGGGGRISVAITSNAFTGTITAHGGSGANNGGAGIFYATSPANSLPILPFIAVAGPYPLLSIDNGGLQGGITPLQFASGVFNNVNLSITGGAFVTNNVGFILQNLLIGSNSTWLAGFASSQQIITVNTNATIQAGGRLMADGISIGTTGQGQTLAATGGGGGHGGFGGMSLSNAPGGTVTQDSATSPSAVGSRGGSGAQGGFGGNGGGALRLNVFGTLQLDGRISADGVSPASLNGGGGSGGSVLVQARKILGAGSISANGGAGNIIGGGGAGGRVALWYDTNQFTGTITARGGSGGYPGGAGTIVAIPSSSGQSKTAQIIVDNGGVRGTNTPISSLLTLPLGGDLIIGSGASVTLSGTANAWNSILISSNAAIDLDPTANTLSLQIASNMTIQAGGSISLDARGYAASQGPGHGIGNTAGNASGASHGGNGGTGAQSTAIGQSYDSISNPTQAGSGGGFVIMPPRGSSAGGGALHLTVNGTLTLDGSISANGSAGLSAGSGGGSGGSVWLSAATLSGAGNISANGGNGEPFGGGGGGGGGRIAVYFNSSRYTGTFSATGGTGPLLAGGAGTIFLRTNNYFAAQLILDNGGEPGADTPLAATSPFANLFVTNGAVADATTPLNLEDLFIGAGGTFSADAAVSLNLTVNGNAVIDTDGAIDGDVHIPSGSGIGAGHLDVYGDGSGGGYGGAGGASMFGAPGGVTYGSSNTPTELGSAGASSPVVPGYSQGGGAVRLNVTGSLTVNGNISANGNDGIIDGSGGGSGGSIWITARSLLGSGSITADGGMGESFEGGGGGGGRIAIYILTNSFSGTVLANGGDGAFPGQNGTIIIATNLIVSGIVTDMNGEAIGGLVVQPSGLGSVTTDNNGFYSVDLLPGWSGSIAPVSGSTFFIPSAHNYSNLSSNAFNQNFVVASQSAFNLAGGQFDGRNVNFNFYGILGATYQVEYSTNLVNWIPYGSPIIGNDTENGVALPVTNAPQMYFRLRVSY